MDGNWGSWSDYGDCSMTCGGGLKRRIRVCNNPAPANGGRKCFGYPVEERVCNTDYCIGEIYAC